MFPGTFIQDSWTGNGIFPGSEGFPLGFSTFFNGLTTVKKGFVNKAPLRMDVDELLGIGKLNNLKTKSWTARLRADVTLSELDNNDVYLRHLSSVDVNTLFSVVFTAPTQELRVSMVDSGSVAFYDETFDLPGLNLSELIIDFNQPLSEITVTVDGVVLDNRPVTIINNFTVDQYAIAFQGTSSTFHSTMLLYNYSLTGIGNTDFISNQDDGLFFESDLGLIWELTEDVAGSSQIDPISNTGSFVWPESTLFIEPETGTLNIGGQFVLADINYDSTQDDIITLVTTLPIVPGSADIMFMMFNDSSTELLTFSFNVFPFFRVLLFNGTAVEVSDSLPFDFSTVTSLGIKLEASGPNILLTGMVNNVLSSSTKTIDMTGKSFNKLIIGTDQSHADTAAMNIKSLHSNQLGTINFNQRLWPLASSDRFTYTSSNATSDVYTLGDDTDLNDLPLSVFPNTLADRDTLISSGTTIFNFLGDSITFGTGAPTGYTVLTENHFTNKGVTNVTWINDGVSGYDAFHLAPTGFDFSSFPNGHAPDTDRNITHAFDVNNADAASVFIDQNANEQLFSLAETKAPIDAIVQFALDRNKVLFLFTEMPRSSTEGVKIAFSNDLSAHIRSKAVPGKVIIVEVNETLNIPASSPNVLDLAFAAEPSDPRLHPNQLGAGEISVEFIAGIESVFITDAHLVEDIAIEVESGSPELQFIGKIAQAIRGIFQFIIKP